MTEINNRRGFLKTGIKTLGVCACAGGLATLLNSCEFYDELQPASRGITKKINIDTDIDYAAQKIKREYFENKGYGVKVQMPDVNYGIPLILVRMAKDEIACFSSLCTHDNCFGDEVTPPKGYFPNRPALSDYRLIICSCHGSQFDPWNEGKPAKGPAEKALKRYKTEYNIDTKILEIYF